MKKLLVITAVTLASASAFATKARMSSLGEARHLVDVQTIFVNPADLTLMGTWATFETGPTDPALTPAVNPKAEAGFARANGDARWGFYLGHTGRPSALRETASAAHFLGEENPINLFYAAKMADISWGLGLNYSNSDRKATGKQSTTGLAAGMRMGLWDASLNFGITDSAEVPTVDKWTGKNLMDLRAGYLMDTWYFYGQYTMDGGKNEPAGGGAATSDQENNSMRLGFINTNKVDGGEFFWGAAYAMSTTNDKAAGKNKVETTDLPVIIGIEADAASWLVLRGSITQTVLLSSSKTTPVGGAAGETQTLANNTTVAAGAGLKFNKFTLDASLAGATTGNINGTDLLANAGLTYNF